MLKLVRPFIGAFVWMLALSALIGGFAFAQDAPMNNSIPGFDFVAWGKSAVAFGWLGVVPAVALIKGQFPTRGGWWVLGISFVLSEGGAFWLYSQGLLTDPAYTTFTPPAIWMLFGFSAFLIASGGWAAIVQLLKKRHAPPLTATATATQPATATSPATPPTAEVVVNPVKDDHA